MKAIYSAPLRVYLIMLALAAGGIYCGVSLPISLFPNSSKPTVVISVPYSSLSPAEFIDSYGKELEDSLRTLNVDHTQVESVEGIYGPREVSYEAEFSWGTDPQNALKEVRSVLNSFSSRLPEESRRGQWVYLDDESSGFFAMSFYSETRDLNQLYDILEPLLTPVLTEVRDAEKPILWNPSSREVRIQLKPEAMAALGVIPRSIEDAVRSSLSGRSGGTVTSLDPPIRIEMPRLFSDPLALGELTVQRQNGKPIHLSEVAQVAVGPKTMETRSFRTNGVPSLILFATPRAGGNIKQMSEDLLRIVETAKSQFPSDVQYRVLVDPSGFIRSAVNNVLHEVGIAALLAVIVLFFFIGSFRNVATAALEIPMSMVLAFILMKWSGMNLNLISLGGLALSAGMNVDASVVVMENVFRHFELTPGPHSFRARVEIVIEAVREVTAPIVASTFCSLVVFAPLIFNSGLSYAILGDLALAVVFSHGLSAVIALVLVPTIRLQLMSKNNKTAVPHSPIERWLRKLEDGYSNALEAFLMRSKWQQAGFVGSAALLIVSLLLVIPRIPQEVLGRPDTDWMVLNIETSGNDLLSQMEHQVQSYERDLLDHFGGEISYTFSQCGSPNRGKIMARLKDKRNMNTVWKTMEKHFSNTPTTKFFVIPWNPSELPIPDPPQLQLTLRGGTSTERTNAARDLFDRLQQSRAFDRFQTDPGIRLERKLVLLPVPEQWSSIRKSGSEWIAQDIADLSRIATTGKEIAMFPVGAQSLPIVMSVPHEPGQTLEDVLSLPVGLGSRIVPLRALAKTEVQYADPHIFRRNGSELISFYGRVNHGEEATAPARLEKAKRIVADWQNSQKAEGGPLITASIDDPAPQITEAKRQLVFSALLSVGLVLLILCIQFGGVAEPLIVAVSIPLGVIGVSLSLWIFGSTLSLNSILGVILLNGISVANSLILVDFAKQLFERGHDSTEAVIIAAKARLRPILITSLTTVLGMMPIAFGFGEGGSILQPLGIAVSGGLWFSMMFTLFLVPALHARYLKRTNATHPMGYEALVGGKPLTHPLLPGQPIHEGDL